MPSGPRIFTTDPKPAEHLVGGVDRLPRYVGTMGYDLAQGWFLRRSVQEEALTSAGHGGASVD